jgi:hypothetical protein
MPSNSDIVPFRGSLAIPAGDIIADKSRIPAGVELIINMEAWASAIVRRTPYKEPDPDFLSAMLAYQAITAETAYEVLNAAGIKGLQESIPDVPGAGTGPFELTDLYVAESDFETGNPCYVIMTVTDLELGEEKKYSTGATNIQASLIGLLANGVWPIRAQIKRGDSKDKGGRHVMVMLPPD